jgi:CDP-diacylglycerol pyrophosphatase
MAAPVNVELAKIARGLRSVIAGVGLVLAAPAAANHPTALWHVVHDLCLRDQRLIGRPAPCLAVDRAAGVAVVPDPGGRTQVLLVPTRRIPGIESPELLAPGGPNYWQSAWEARRYVARRARRPVSRDDISLAINSVRSRSQNQLHIHVDCVSPAVRAVLRAHEDRIGFVWTPLGEPLAGHAWKVRRLWGAELGERDPFKLLARGNPAARADMGDQGLAVVGATFADGAPGFYLLSTAGADAFGESLLDHGCAVLRQGLHLVSPAA